MTRNGTAAAAEATSCNGEERKKQQQHQQLRSPLNENDIQCLIKNLMPFSMLVASRRCFLVSLALTLALTAAAAGCYFVCLINHFFLPHADALRLAIFHAP
jgi:hypothetical protein